MARWGFLAVAVSMAACTSVVAPTPSATLLPTAPPRSAGTPVATSTPNATPSSEALEVVFRMAVGGGLRYPGATLEEAPAFSLYENGRVIYARPIDTPPELTARYELWQAQLTAEQMAALLDYAITEAGLGATPDLPAGDVPVADAETTTFELHTADLDNVTSVYYVDYDDPADPNRRARQRLARLAAELRAIDPRVEAGEVTDLGPYEPELYVVTLDEPFGPDQPPVEWPWEDLAAADFAPAQGGLRTAVVDSRQVAQLADPISSVPDNYLIEAEDGRTYLVRVRPLLPDEIYDVR